jgi:HSP20 family protein
MTTTEKPEQKKKANWTSGVIVLLVFLLAVETGGILYYVFQKEQVQKTAQTQLLRGEQAVSPMPWFHHRYYRTQPGWGSFWEEPFSALEQMQQRMNRLFGSMQEPGWGGMYVPTIDLEETDNAYVVRADLPGLKKDKINVSVQNNLLTIQGVRSREAESKDEDRGYYSRERSYGSFTRTVTLPGLVDEANIKAKYADGVLTITLPKEAGAEAKGKIPVE